MMDPTKARHVTPDKRNNWTVTDQLALSLIFAARPLPRPCQHHSHLHVTHALHLCLRRHLPAWRWPTENAVACPCSRSTPSAGGPARLSGGVHELQEGAGLVTEGVEGSRRLVWMARRTVRVMPLPVLAAAGGHTAFVQELHLR